MGIDMQKYANYFNVLKRKYGVETVAVFHFYHTTTNKDGSIFSNEDTLFRLEKFNTIYIITQHTSTKYILGGSHDSFHFFDYDKLKMLKKHIMRQPGFPEKERDEIFRKLHMEGLEGEQNDRT